MSNKTHYRRVFKSDHLSSYDLEDFEEQKKPLIFTIKEVKQEWNTKIAGKTANANICYFKEDVKPLVLNATNSKIVSKLCNSPMVEDWKDVKIQLYILRNIRFGKDNVQGIRIMDKIIKPLAENELNQLKEELKTITDLTELGKLYNSKEVYKIDKKATELITNRANEIKGK